MLVFLSIRSFVLIDRLDLEASEAFTALTGETGAGKSIILDALGLVLGVQANKALVRKGQDEASVTAMFDLPETHPAWAILTEHGLTADPDETLILTRRLSRTARARAFINGQPVAASVLSAVGETLVEIHGQHAASGLMRPASHLALLDAFGDHAALTLDCQQTWNAYEAARAHRRGLSEALKSLRERREWLTFAVEDLEKLAPEEGECEHLTARRTALLQSERLGEAMADARSALAVRTVDDALSKAARALERILRTQGLSALDEGLPDRIQAAADAVERTLIEYTEARSCVEALNLGADHDGQALESTEARLFALRAAGRKYDVAPEALPEILERYRADLALSNSDGEALEMAERVEADTLAQWEQVAASLSAARVDAAERLAASVMQELAALQLGRVKMRTAFTPIGSGESGRYGAERAEFELQTNPGAGFGPLRKIASGGELARMSLALKCALSGTGAQPTLIFDEADQGVGGAVAAAIGERLAALGQDKQVFAITHSPQVASAADRQWRVHKAEQPDGSIVSDVSQLDAHQRLEEIARMLSGSQVTQEARAAASRLLEAA